MIDLHCHILPRIDDGPQSWEDTLAMARMAAKDGITDLVATPHFGKVFYQQGLDAIRKAVHQLGQRLREEGVALRVYPGGDVALDSDLQAWAAAGQLPTIADNGRYFLLEPPEGLSLSGIEQMIFELKLAGLTPIITHPERMEAGDNWAWLRRLVDLGCLSQLTGMSITGGFGPKARKQAHYLLTYGLAHIIASDAHSPRHRPPLLSPAREALIDIVGSEQALLMLKTWPQAVLEGRELELPPPTAPRRRRWFFFGR
ncbi:MAG: CpsB/CapC family capsule biosynthesis tyrosine phosphatase [Pseudomonadota bacterium]